MQNKLRKQIESEPFFYNGYPLNQMFGAQSNLPILMESSQKLRNEYDIKAYIIRLFKFGTKFDQVLEGLRIREKRESFLHNLLSTV